MVELGVTGVDEVRKMFSKLSEEIGTKVAREAVRDATKIIHKEALYIFNSNWHNRTGNLQASIKIIKRKSADGKKLAPTEHMYSVMAKRITKTKIYTASNGKKIKVKGVVADGFYAKFLEYGTSTIPARPFMRPAAENKKDEAFEHFKWSIVKKANAIIKKGS